uniref:Ornithine decarboxylase n=1 Tax=Nannospalax galili TaxID=1026970 RepID=A0A8C6W2D1_NANGA
MNNFNKVDFDCHISMKFLLLMISAFYKHLRWLKTLSRVTPFCAVKCNDSRASVNTLAAIGTGFDCASKTEIQLAQSLGVPPERIIYANSWKQMCQIKYAASNGLMKVTRAHLKAKLVLRLATDDSKAACHLSVKSGATVKTSRLLLEQEKELKIDVIGVTSHTGSGCTDPETFMQAVLDARCVFDMGAELGFSMHLLDNGGGFPGPEDTKLKSEELTSVIKLALDKYFPSDSGMRIIAEPAFMLAINIIEQTNSDDEDESNEQTFMYYVNDRIYGSFNCILYDHAHVKPLLQKRPNPDEKYYSFSIWGPMCDGLDQIIEYCNLPEMHVGDWMLFENMGAYTVAAASTFNGFQRPMIYHEIQNHDFPLEVKDTLPMSCAQESGMDFPPAACASASINV